jgi:hypothetical protein
MSNLIKLLYKTPCNALLEEILTDLGYNDAEQEVLSEVLTWLYMNGRLKLTKEVEEKGTSNKPHSTKAVSNYINY